MSENHSGEKQSLLDYIKSHQWFFGVRAEESLLFYSAKRNGYRKYLKHEYGSEFAETLLIPIKRDRPIRVFNLRQAKEFHAISKGKIQRHPHCLISYIEKNDRQYQDIAASGQQLIGAIKQGHYPESIRLFKDILRLYEIASAQFIVIFSLGLMLAKNKSTRANIRRAIKKHNRWRNSVAFKEEALGENLFRFSEFLVKRKGLKLAPLLLMKFLTWDEIAAWLAGKVTDAAIERTIKRREGQGFIYINLRNTDREVVDSRAEIAKIRKYFLELDKESPKTQSGNEITGQVAYSSHRILKGKVLVIKDKTELKNKSRSIGGKILVAIQTTPHYIPYLKKAKAMITDEGGLTCHAAIVAREFKIPCIIGTKTATQVLRDDDLVEIDTRRGIIKQIDSG